MSSYSPFFYEYVIPNIVPPQGMAASQRLTASFTSSRSCPGAHEVAHFGTPRGLVSVKEGLPKDNRGIRDDLRYCKTARPNARGSFG